MIIKAFIVLLGFIIDLYLFILIARFSIFCCGGVSEQNQIYGLIKRFTDPLIQPFKKMSKLSKHSVEWFILFWIIVLTLFKEWLIFLLTTGFHPNIFGLFVLTIGQTGSKFTHLFISAMILQSIFSWTPALQYSALGEICMRLSGPLCRLVRPYLKNWGGIDWSPTVVILGLLLLSSFIFYPIIKLGIKLISP